MKDYPLRVKWFVALAFSRSSFRDLRPILDQEDELASAIRCYEISLF